MLVELIIMYFYVGGSGWSLVITRAPNRDRRLTLFTQQARLISIIKLLLLYTMTLINSPAAGKGHLFLVYVPKDKKKTIEKQD